jgi:hypothetical protein
MTNLFDHGLGIREVGFDPSTGSETYETRAGNLYDLHRDRSGEWVLEGPNGFYLEGLSYDRLVEWLHDPEQDWNQEPETAETITDEVVSVVSVSSFALTFAVAFATAILRVVPL